MQNTDTLTELYQALDRHIRRTIDERVKIHLKAHGEANTPQIMTQEVACKELGISRTTLSTWRKEGKVPYHRKGHRVYFDRVELLNAMKSVNGKKKPKR